MNTEREKMIAGEFYNPMDPELVQRRARGHRICQRLNDTTEDEIAVRREIFQELFARGGDTVWIEPPFYCDYGDNITLGNLVFFNFNCVILDVAPVTIGDRTMFGPAVQIYSASHPMDWRLRAEDKEFGKPVAIGSNVWVGGAVVFSPGVTVGDRTVIGAGSVVTRNIPDDVFAAGNPCRVIREVVYGALHRTKT